jgi:uncharacterized protein involved in exopolysaccharide biosynthesis
MSAEKVYVEDFLKVIVKRKNRLFLFIGAGVLTFIALSFVLPKKYKSTAIMNVYTKYFKNPLVGQVVAELQNTDEIKNNLTSLVNQAIDDSFVDSVGERYQIYKYGKEKIKRNAERELLRQRFQINALGAQSFQISFIYSDPSVAKEVATESLNRIIKHLVNTRRQTIETIKESIRKRIEVMSLSQDRTTNPLASSKPDVLKRQLISINSQIDSLKAQYSMNHPSILELLEKKKIIENWLKTKHPGEDTDHINEKDQMPILGSDSKYAVSEINKDLLTKYNYLNIISELENGDNPDYIGIVQHAQIPASPVFPNKMLFAIFGLLLGVVASAISILIEEFVWARSSLYHIKISKELHIPFLGKLPKLQTELLDHQVTNNKGRDIHQ